MSERIVGGWAMWVDLQVLQSAWQLIKYFIYRYRVSRLCTTICFLMTLQFAKAKSFSFLLQEPQGEVLIITSVPSFSVFIQKSDHTPQRLTEQDTHTHTHFISLVHSLLSDGSFCLHGTTLSVQVSCTGCCLTAIILIWLVRQVEWLQQSSSGQCTGISFHHTNALFEM